MDIRNATPADLPGINKLLYQVAQVHHDGRPDLFWDHAKKYYDEELLELMGDSERPIFVAHDETGEVLGYAFCVFQQHLDDNILTPIKTFYIDDLCVDETRRGQHVGTALYKYVLDFARANDCYNVTLNVWECNPNARKFYEAMGLVPYKTGMEKIL